MHKIRLLELADFLHDEVALKPRYKFDMGRWADLGFDPDRCHTAACAFGWASVRFPKHLKRVPYLDEMLIHCGYYKGDAAAREFFQIDKSQSIKIFIGGRGNNTPRQVAATIRRVVREHEQDGKS